MFRILDAFHLMKALILPYFNDGVMFGLENLKIQRHYNKLINFKAYQICECKVGL